MNRSELEHWNSVLAHFLCSASMSDDLCDALDRKLANCYKRRKIHKGDTRTIAQIMARIRKLRANAVSEMKGVPARVRIKVDLDQFVCGDEIEGEITWTGSFVSGELLLEPREFEIL